MDIVTEGRERFEVMHMDQERSFLRAEVLYLRDEPATATAAEIERALNLHGEIMGLAGAAPEKAAEIDRSRLSFHLAGSLPLDLDFKQTLLGMNPSPSACRELFRTSRPYCPVCDVPSGPAREQEATGTWIECSLAGVSPRPDFFLPS